MIIEKTNIPDITEKNIDEAKITLADSIIENVYPLFDELLQDRSENLHKIQNEYDKKSSQVKEGKENLEGLMLKLERAKKETKLLTRIDKLINSGLVNDGSMKHENVILLKIFNKLSDEKLEFHLRNTLKIISKRFNQ
jgi:flagellar hook-basal body complex protein FliE